MRFLCILSLFVALSTSTSMAEDFSDAALLKLFQQQRDAFAAARKSGTGKTRGLTLMTIDAAPATSLAGTLETPTLEGNDISLPIADGTVSVQSQPDLSIEPLVDKLAEVENSPAQIQPVVFGALVPELQVNLFIQFAFDSAALTSDQEPALAQMCSVMKSSDINLFRIAGHTDASGTEDYNQKLSQLRAEEVERYLVNDCGIAASKLEALGLGEKFLSDPKDPKSADNRRVEFQALS